jgi:hypothetical protein
MAKNLAQTTAAVATTATIGSPAMIIGSTANCAVPANTTADIITASHGDMPRSTARTPNATEIAE